jgi:hypothetical protein
MSNDAIAGSELEVGRRKHLGTVINCLTLSASNVLPRPGCVERLPQECMSIGGNSIWQQCHLDSQLRLARLLVRGNLGRGIPSGVTTPT